MKRRVLELACGVALLAAGAVLFVHRAPPPGPAAAPKAAIPPGGLPAPRLAGAAAIPPGPIDPAAPATWSRRLTREDEILVKQAVEAGCDGERAAKLRDLLAKKRATRERTIADYEAGKITEKEMHTTAHAAKKEFDAAAKELLGPDELEALDPVAARAQILNEEKQPR
ncbi:MAG: hypothetical protein ACAI25_10655 [Planctomycetota bacterium]